MRNNFFYIVLSLLVLLSSCRNEDVVKNICNDEMYSRVYMNFSSSDDIESVKCIFFKDDNLSYTGSIQNSDNELKLPLEGQGRLYLIANDKNTINPSVDEGMTDSEWQNTCIGLDDSGKPIKFVFGKVDILNDIADYSVIMKRGVARFDVVYAFPDTEISSITLKGMAEKSYLVEKVPFAVPFDAGKIDIKVERASMTGKDQTGVFYAYEQINPDATVEIEMPDGKINSAKLPEYIKRNKVYTLQIGRDGNLHSITIGDWVKEEDEILKPDRDTFITVNVDSSILNDKATVSSDYRSISVSYLPCVFDVALNCVEELEYVNASNDIVDVIQVNPDASTLTERNIFRITKKLVPPNYFTDEVKLQFKRKAFTEFYEEDQLTVILEKNDDTLEGLLDFNNDSYECDFGKYIEGNLGVYTVGEGKTLSLEVSEDNPWVRLVEVPENRNSYIIQAGWKPNDPEADGRVQSAKLVITDRNGNKQEYTVKRRNFGLPVIKLNDIWWCKYNAIGNSRDFNDQILCANDPARISGQTVLDYLKNCTDDEFLKLWNSAYGGNSGQAMTAVYKNSKFVLEGYKSNESVHINHLDPKLLAPEGYEMPTFDDYKRILGTFSVPTSPTPFNPSNGGEVYRSQIFMDKREGVMMGDAQMPEMRFITVSSLKDKGTEPLTIYGVGCQWNNDGINGNWLLIANYNPSTTGWLYRPTNGNLEHNGAAANNTRIVRFKKSDVEYIYGE
ncbi:MAG: hypothetical protein SOX26_07845 [Phocaeicola sp.]|nr:hypothetical protein [Phocaeicola sp.]